MKVSTFATPRVEKIRRLTASPLYYRIPLYLSANFPFPLFGIFGKVNPSFKRGEVELCVHVSHCFEIQYFLEQCLAAITKSGCGSKSNSKNFKITIWTMPSISFKWFPNITDYPKIFLANIFSEILLFSMKRVDLRGHPNFKNHESIDL